MDGILPVCRYCMQIVLIVIKKHIWPDSLLCYSVGVNAVNTRSGSRVGMGIQGLILGVGLQKLHISKLVLSNGKKRKKKRLVSHPYINVLVAVQMR